MNQVNEWVFSSFSAVFSGGWWSLCQKQFCLFMVWNSQDFAQNYTSFYFWCSAARPAFSFLFPIFVHFLSTTSCGNLDVSCLSVWLKYVIFLICDGLTCYGVLATSDLIIYLHSIFLSTFLFWNRGTKNILQWNENSETSILFIIPTFRTHASVHTLNQHFYASLCST